MTSHDHVVRGSCGIIGEFLSSQAVTPPSVVAIDFVEEEITCFEFVT